MPGGNCEHPGSERAEQTQERLASSTSTVGSPDGSVAVTVGPGGNLTGLTLTERAYQQQPHQLAALIMRLAAQAQQQVGAQMLAAFSGLVADSPALDVVTPFLAPQPADEEPEPPAPHPDEPFDAHPGGYGPPVTQPPPTGEIQRRPRRRPDPGQDVEPDYDEGDF
ncbi:MAG TPA: YbaB/EbfC family nucleoid-associated protein [Pseudonocardiaceae bacterium]|nr:YbaB/EbfC family nucleoid-associated protein [Pseudonocardiaceae bacterium]